MIMAAFAVNAQVAINKDGSAPDANSILHVKNNSGSQFIFSDTDGNLRLQSYESTNIYVGNAYLEFGNSNGGFYSVGYIGKASGNSNLEIYSNVGLWFEFSSGTSHRLTGSGFGLGTTTPSEMLDVKGNATISGDVTAGNDIMAIADIEAGGAISAGANIDADGDITAGGDVTANGDLWGTNEYLTDNLEIGGDAQFSGRLTLGGASLGSRQLAIEAGSNIGVYVSNNNATYSAIYANNTGGGPAIQAWIGDILLSNGNIIMKDGNQGTNKLMVSDANGQASWENVNDGVRTRVINIENAGSSTDVVVWTHPSDIEVKFNTGTQLVTVENKSGTTEIWTAVIKGGATGYNSVKNVNYKRRNIKDGSSWDKITFDLGTLLDGYFDITCTNKTSNEEGFVLHVVFAGDDINGMVQYWDN